MQEQQTKPKLGHRAQTAWRLSRRWKGREHSESGGARPSTVARLGWRNLYSRNAAAKRRVQNDELTLEDVEKSRVLFMEAFVATPMLIIFASSINLDGSHESRVPVLLEQITVHVKPFENKGQKNLFQINLQYGGGASQMKWELVRSYRDFMFLHGHLVKNQVWHGSSEPKPPHLPRLKDYGRRSKNENGEQEDDNSSIGSTSGPRFATLESAMENYLEKIFTRFRFHDSNRLLAFIELSLMSLTLFPEYAFHGKQGNLYVYTRASEQGWRVRHWQPQDVNAMVRRHTAKWTLVCESFILLVKGLNSCEIQDVFLVDPKFSIKTTIGKHQGAQGLEKLEAKASDLKSFVLNMENSARSLKLLTRGEHDLRQWVRSINSMVAQTPWGQPHRFDSFAPVRTNVASEWFVDGRDYMWVLSEALENARDTIFILDWWLSPELYLRRPPEGNQKWRLDRILKRRAEAGVKIYVVVYRNIEISIPIDSFWTKHSLLDLHKNIHILRSPNQFLQKKAVFWAHHEKVCIIDNTIAFCGGIDLCFGRWDTPQHSVVDDARTPFYADNKDATAEKRAPVQTWVGKDYSNPRVKDFFELNKPFEDMYDRQVTPRMPWHDVHQTVLGQPARDLARHFVQRWNYVIRQKQPSRPTPLLLPPPDFTKEELERLNLTGTCEYQVLRSSCDWSLGLKEHEQSIQNAYLKLIDTSEHFVYIENQFFVTSTEVDGVLIENQIGSALVQRIMRAEKNREKWKAYIVIPLMPGFEAQVDAAEASSVRLICQCQYNSISRGTKSIFYRLESAGIRPENYITFCSLRKWGKIGPEHRLTTEQLYIHAKLMVVDDRSVIIGSANINERSMRGVRDSEVAVCVRDTQVVESVMDGKPYQAARFAYTLRLRVMREHLGIDIDKVDAIEQLTEFLTYNSSQSQSNQKAKRNSHPMTKKTRGSEPSVPEADCENILDDFKDFTGSEVHSFNYYGGTEVNPGVRDHKKFSQDRRIHDSESHRRDVEGYGIDQMAFRDEIDRENMVNCLNPAMDQKDKDDAISILNEVLEKHNPPSLIEFKRTFYKLWCGVPLDREETVGMLPLPVVDRDGNVHKNESYYLDPWSFQDPVSDQFFFDKWVGIANRNTDIYRQVFRCQPDNLVESWREYKRSQAHMATFYERQAKEGGPEVKRSNAAQSRAPDRIDNHVLEGEIDSTNPEHLSKHPSVNDGNSQKKKDRKDKASDEDFSVNHPISKDASWATEKDNVSDHPVLNGVNGVNGSASSPEKSPSKNAEDARGEPHENGAPPSSGSPEKSSSKNTENTRGEARKNDATLSQNAPDSDPKDKKLDNDDSTSASSSSDDVNHYTNKPTSSTAAALPGIPSLATLWGGNQEKFDPSDSEFPEDHEPSHPADSEGMKRDGSKATNREAHSHHRKKPNMVEEETESETNAESRGRPRTNTTNTQRHFTATRPWRHFEEVMSAQSAEEVLTAVTGNLVIFPTEWLRKEIESGNWNFQMDRMTPLEIYD